MNPRRTHSQSRAPGRGPAAASPGSRASDHGPSHRTAIGDVRAASRDLIAQGFQRAEVGNLTAWLYGLAPVSGGWTVDEIERLLFVRHLDSSGRIGS